MGNEEDRVLPAHPRPVRDPRGLKTNVPKDVREAVILQPSLLPEAACLRSSIEEINWQFGAYALAAMATDSIQSGPLRGAQNWWSHFANTFQYANYPLSIAGVPLSQMR